MGFDNFKIVERNTPTPELLRRVKAYANRRYEGNLLDLVLPFQYPAEAYTTKASRDAYSFRRAVKYFFRPGAVNLGRVLKLDKLGRRMGLLYPRQGKSGLDLDNRKLDKFIDRFLTKSCIDVDCDKCRYCHEFAKNALTIDPDYRRDVLALYRDMAETMHDGSFWSETKPQDLIDVGRLLRRKAADVIPGVGEPAEGIPPCSMSDST
jgi:hypothetical protein